MSDDAAIFLVQDHAVGFSIRMIDLGWGRCFVFGSLIISMVEFHDNVIVASSRLLIKIRSVFFGISEFCTW